MSIESRIRGCSSSKVRELMRSLAQHYDAEVAQSGIKTTQYALLARVAEFGPLRPVDLAEIMKMTASTLSRNLQPLVHAGWIDIARGEDARSHLVSLTPAGLAKRQEASQYWRAAQRKLNARVGPERVLALHELIDDILGLLGEEGASNSGGDGSAPAASRTGKSESAIH